MTTKYLWCCNKNHKWWAIATSLNKFNSTWCPDCSHSQKKTFEQIKKKAEERKGKCLSDEYFNNHTKLKWECEFGHIWEATYGSIRNHWCPECSQNISYNEIFCKEIINQMFNCIFVKIRPDWLINPKTGKLLELDLFNEDLKLAFEIQGEQHYKFCNRFHKQIEDLYKQQDRDKVKLEICKNREIVLIYIPYFIKIENMQDYIITECEKNNIEIFNKQKINPNDINIFLSKYILLLEKLNEIVKSKDGFCLCDKYIPKGMMKFKCKNGHIWETRPRNIETGGWCLQCYRNEQKGYTIEKINIIAYGYNCECISDKYINNCLKLDWKCNLCNNKWSCDLSSMLKKHKKKYFCSFCMFK